MNVFLKVDQHDESSCMLIIYYIPSTAYPFSFSIASLLVPDFPDSPKNVILSGGTLDKALNGKTEIPSTQRTCLLRCCHHVQSSWSEKQICFLLSALWYKVAEKKQLT